MNDKVFRVPMWHRGHHNAIAKEIRSMLLHEGAANPNYYKNLANSRWALCELALRLTRRFAEDNSNFDPMYFLTKCSPDPDSYPLTELWEGSPSSD